MENCVFRSFDTPLRKAPSWEERWNGTDRGLVSCWEVGRKLRANEPELAMRAEKNELPVLVYKGGVGKVIQKKEKFGSLYYLAAWQGLRGEDLNINIREEQTIVCSKTGMQVTYTSNYEKYANA